MSISPESVPDGCLEWHHSCFVYPLDTQPPRPTGAVRFRVLPLCIAGLVASVARGPLVALSIAVLIGSITWLSQGRLRMRTALVLLLLFSVGIGGAYWLCGTLISTKYTPPRPMSSQTLATGGSSSGSAGKRLDFYRATHSRDS